MVKTFLKTQSVITNLLYLLSRSVVLAEDVTENNRLPANLENSHALKYKIYIFKVLFYRLHCEGRQRHVLRKVENIIFRNK